MRNLAAISALVLLLPNFPLQAQRASEEIRVTLVEVPVNVLRDGEPVRDLAAANFEIYDEGQKRSITNFEMIDFSKRSATAAPAMVSSPAARRKFLILFDMGNAAVPSLIRSQEAALDFVSHQVLPSDRVGVATISMEQGFRLLVGFTTDRQLARTAIETLGLPKFYKVRDPLLIAAAFFSEQADAIEGGGARPEIVEEWREMARTAQRSANQIQTQAIARQLDHLSELGRVLDRVSGKKQVVLLSEGFDPKMLRGREAGSSAEQREEQAALEAGEVWKVDTDNRYGASASVSHLRRMVDVLRRSDVVLHAIDIKGLHAAGDPTGSSAPVATAGAGAGGRRDPARSQESLHLLTRDTGGIVFKNSNDLSSEFERMMKSQEVTYVLGFSGEYKTPGKFHELKVKLVGVPRARVMHRVGYYEPSAAATDLDRTLSAGEIVMNSIPMDEIGVRGMAAPLPSQSGPAQVAVVLEIDGKSLLQDVRDKTLTADAFIYAFDEKEIIRDFAYQRLDLDTGKLREKLAGKGVKLYQTLRLTPGHYSLRVLLRSANGQRNGFRSIPLHVPAAGERYVMSPLLFDDTSGWVMVKGPERDPTLTYPFHVGADTFVPALRPSLSQGVTYTLALFAYHLQGNLNVQASIDDGTSLKPIPLSPLGRAPAADGMLKLVYELKPPQLAHGEYSLVLNVRDATGAHNQVTIPFIVN